MFQMKGISDLALLPVTSSVEGNLDLHICWENYVANMYVNMIRLRMCLDDSIYQVLIWRDDCFPYVLETCHGKGDDRVSEYEFTDDEINNTSDSKK